MGSGPKGVGVLNKLREYLKYNQALKITLNYLVIGFLWILFSDSLAEFLFKKPEVLRQVQTIKGWLFVGVTGAFLFMLLYYQFRQINGIHKNLIQKNDELTASTEELIAMEDELQKRVVMLDRYTNELKNRNDFIGQIYNGINCIIMVWRKDGRIIEANRYFTEILGYDAAEAVNQKWSDLILPKEDQTTFNEVVKRLEAFGEINNSGNVAITKSGKRLNFLWNDRLVNLGDGEETMVISFGIDVTKTFEKDLEIKRLLYLDKITKAPNAAKMELDCRELIQQGKPFTLALANIHQLGKINNQFGIKTGDQVIVKVYETISQLFEQSQAYKWHEGSFIILINEINKESIRKKMDVLTAQFAKRLIIDGKEMVTGLNIGLTQFPNNGVSFEKLIHFASYASFYAKSNTTKKYAFFSDQMLDELNQSIEAEIKLTEALAGNQLELYLQPLHHVKENRITSAEILLRSHSADFYFESIIDFIKIAERSGQIVDVDLWVIKNTFELCTANEVIGALDIGINLSAQTFTSMRFIPFLQTMKSQYRINPSQIVFELTEHSVVDDFERAKEVIKALKSMGFSVSLDDFGSEYSSLKYISKLDFDCIKIDKSFIDELIESVVDREIVEGIIRLSHRIGVDVVAEGVETLEQFHLLKEMGCTFIQGYLISKPLSVNSLMERLKRHDWIE